MENPSWCLEVGRETGRRHQPQGRDVDQRGREPCAAGGSGDLEGLEHKNAHTHKWTCSARKTLPPRDAAKAAQGSVLLLGRAVPLFIGLSDSGKNLPGGARNPKSKRGNQFDETFTYANLAGESGEVPLGFCYPTHLKEAFHGAWPSKQRRFGGVSYYTPVFSFHRLHCLFERKGWSWHDKVSQGNVRIRRKRWWYRGGGWERAGKLHSNV